MNQRILPSRNSRGLSWEGKRVWYLLRRLLLLTFLFTGLWVPSSGYSASNSFAEEEDEESQIVLVPLKVGLCVPIDGQFQLGPVLSVEVYWQHIKHLSSFALGPGFSLRRYGISSSAKPETGGYYSSVVEAKNVFVGNFYFNLLVLSNRNSYFGFGVGYFLAESDRVTQLSSRDLVGEGLSYQLRAGLKSKSNRWKMKFLAEARYELMKPQKSTSPRLESEDFGGFSVSLGIAF